LNTKYVQIISHGIVRLCNVGLVVISFFGFAKASECPADRIDERVTVRYVVDGDTLGLNDGRKVRMLGINAPETAHHSQLAEPFASQSLRALKRFLKNSPTISLRFERVRKDRYQRLLAHVFTESGMNVQAFLLQRGLAAQITIPPNTWQAECYATLEKKAISKRLNMWSHPRFMPWEVSDTKPPLQGFYRISGVISTVTHRRSSIWLQLTNQFSLRIMRKDLPYFHPLDINKLKNKRVIAKGWLFPYKKRSNMLVRHFRSLEVIN